MKGSGKRQRIFLCFLESKMAEYSDGWKDDPDLWDDLETYTKQNLQILEIQILLKQNTQIMDGVCVHFVTG